MNQTEELDILGEDLRVTLIKQARSLGHSWICPEHLIHLFLANPNYDATVALLGFGVKLDWLDAIVRTIDPQEGQHSPEEIGLTPRMKKVLAFAKKAAGKNPVGTLHLLLGILQEGEGNSAQALMKLGVTLEGVQQRLAVLPTLQDVEGFLRKKRL